MIFTDDHPPPHVHVYGDGEAKIAIGDEGHHPFVLYAEHMRGSVQRRAVKAIAGNQPELLARWMDLHG